MITNADGNIEVSKDRVASLISTWKSNVLAPIALTRRLIRVDVTADQLQREGVIAADETFIGTKVIAVAINRELPRVFTFLTDSPKFLLFDNPAMETAELQAFEEWFAKMGRNGSWIIPLLSVYYSGAMYGKAWAEVVYDKTDPLGTKVEYVPAENFIYPQGATDIQMAGMVARKFPIPVSFLKTFGKKLLFDADQMDKICDKHQRDLYWTDTTDVYKVYYRNAAEQVVCRWFSMDTQDFLSPEVFHTSGAFGSDGKAIPSLQYPFIVFQYAISGDQAISEWQGRGDFDESSQEAVQGLFSAYVNGASRASGFYPYLDSQETDGSRKVNQLSGLQHNKIADKKLGILSIPYPSADLLFAVQAMRAQAANDAGQTDFATTSKRVANTTATEIAASEKQAALMSTVGVSMIALFMYNVEKYRFEIFKTNVSAKIPPEVLGKLSGMVSYSVVDRLFRSRDEKVELAKRWFEQIKTTSAAIPFMLEILKKDLPDMYEVVKSNIQDPKPIGQALLQLLTTIGEQHPEYAQDPNFQKVYATATQTFGRPAPSGPGGTQQIVAPGPNDNPQAQGAGQGNG